jgi:hypothetical protein
MARQLQAGEPNNGPLSSQRVADLDNWFDMSGDGWLAARA